MAVVTGLTAARMLAIEAASVVNGLVVGDDLILTKFNGDQINAGVVRGVNGAVGPAGPAGSAGLAGAAGVAGVAGVAGAPGLVHRGPWAAATSYILNDAVYEAGGTYRALKPVVGGSVPSVAVDIPQVGAQVGELAGPAGTYSSGRNNRQPFTTVSSQDVGSVSVPITNAFPPTAPVTATLRRQSDGVALASGTLAAAAVQTIAAGAALSAYVYNVFTFSQAITLPAGNYWLDLDSTADFSPVIFSTNSNTGTHTGAITASTNWSRPPEATQAYKMPFRLLGSSYTWARVAVKGDTGSAVATLDIGDSTGKTSAQIDALFTTVPPNGTLATGLIGTVPTLFMRRIGTWHSSGTYTQIA